MPTNATTVGGFSVPVAADTIADALADPLCLGLLDYCAHWLNYGLNAKLAVQIGRSATAVPTANRFPFDPRKAFVRKAVPALYVWTDGSREVTEWSTVRRMVRREVKLMWVFDELVSPNGLTKRHGLLRAVDDLLTLAETTDRHETWPDSSSSYFGTYDPGVQFGPTFGLRRWQKQSSEYGATWEVPGDAVDGAVQYGLPSLRTSFLVEEIVGTETYADPADLLVGNSLIVDAGDGLEDGVVESFIESNHWVPDGSEP